MRNDFESNYLQHWGLKKGEKRKNHKYFERIEKNGRYIYFYTQAEYEAWLHKGQKGLEKTKNKAKSKLNSLTTKKTNTKSSILSAISKGKTLAYNFANRSQTFLKKSNVQATIDRGNKAISSILSRTSKQVQSAVSNAQRTSKVVSNKIQSTVSNAQKASKTVSANIQQRAKKIANNVSNTLKKTGKDTQKAVQKYVSKGEETINKTLAKAGKVKMNSAQKTGGIGTTIIASLLAGVAVAAIRLVAPIVAKKAKELIDKIIHPENTITVTTETKPKERPKENPPADFSSDSKRSYKEDRAAHSDIPQKEEPTTRDEDMAAVNPNLDKEEYEKVQQLVEDYYAAEARGDYDECNRIYDEYMLINDKYGGYMNNCVDCTLAYDLRRRGYDIDAAWNPYGTYQETALSNWYEGVESVGEYSYGGFVDGNHGGALTNEEISKIKNKIESKYPEGAYGHLQLFWSDNGGGHDVVWSIENGELVLRDCQINQVVSFEEYAAKSEYVEFWRTDNKKLKDTAYELATAEKANTWGEADYDEKEDDRGQYLDMYEEDGQIKYKTEEDLKYDKYWRKAAGKKRK